MAALATLTKLSGIGPATASLLLSTAAPDAIPFFSDELYRWLTFDDSDTGKGRGWRRKIGYTAREYKMVIERVSEVKSRIGVGARDVELVAFVLGKEMVAAAADASEPDRAGANDGKKRKATDTEEIKDGESGATRRTGRGRQKR